MSTYSRTYLRTSRYQVYLSSLLPHKHCRRVTFDVARFTALQQCEEWALQHTDAQLLGHRFHFFYCRWSVASHACFHRRKPSVADVQPVTSPQTLSDSIASIAHRTMWLPKHGQQLFQCVVVTVRSPLHRPCKRRILVRHGPPGRFHVIPVIVGYPMRPLFGQTNQRAHESAQVRAATGVRRWGGSGGSAKLEQRLTSRAATGLRYHAGVSVQTTASLGMLSED